MCDLQQLLPVALGIVPKTEDTCFAGAGRLGDEGCRVDPSSRSRRLCQSQLGIPWLHSPPTWLGRDLPNQVPRSSPAKPPGVAVGLQGALRGAERTHTARVPRLSRVFSPGQSHQPALGDKCLQRKERHLLTLDVLRIPGNRFCGVFFPTIRCFISQQQSLQK